LVDWLPLQAAAGYYALVSQCEYGINLLGRDQDPPLFQELTDLEVSVATDHITHGLEECPATT